MATFTMEESDWAGYIEDGSIHSAELTSVQARTAPFTDNDGNPVKQVEFKFTINDGGDYDGQPVYGNTPQIFNASDRCKLRNWAQAILNSELPVGYKLDTDTLVGRECRIQVGLKTTEKEGTVKQRNFVADVFPAAGSVDFDF